MTTPLPAPSSASPPPAPPIATERSSAVTNELRTWCGATDHEAVLAILRAEEEGGGRLTYPVEDTGRGDWHRWNGRYHASAKGPDVVRECVERWFDVLAAVVSADTPVAAGLAREIKAGELSGADAADAAAFIAAHTGRADYHRRLSFNAGRRGLVNALKDRCAVADDTYDGTGERDWAVLADGQVLDLAALRRRGEVVLLPADRDRPVHRAMGARYDPDARAPGWRHFLETSLPDPELRTYLQTCAGAALLGDPSAKRIPHLVGPKNSGKSTTLKALINLFGGYGGWVTATALLDVQGQNFDREAFRGKRFVAISEPVRTRLDDAFLLSITGGEPVRTGRKGRDFTEWLPECVVNIAANQVVRFDTRAEEVLSRVDVVTFDQSFEPRAASELSLDAELAGEVDGILNWLIGGAMRFAREGVVVPAAVLAAREDTADDASSARLWLDQAIEAHLFTLGERDPLLVSPREWATVSEAYALYVQWTKDVGEKPLSRRFFSRDLAAKLGPHVMSDGTRLRGLSATDPTSMSAMSTMAGGY